MHRDAQSRFVATPRCPFPFSQLDKLAERRFCEGHNIEQPKLLFTLTQPSELLVLGSQLPPNWVIKPVGAGHSDGVVVVRDGICVNRGGPRLDLAAIVSELEALVSAGGTWHNGTFFQWNLSKFLIEELVVDEDGACPPRDYKFTVLGGRLLWALIGYRIGIQLWVAFVDASFCVLPPALDPSLLWRIHGVLVCTDAAMLPKQPACWEQMVRRALDLGTELNVFARLDWYADAARGPLLGEVTLFPHILQPRAMHSGWANALVSRLWHAPDGCAPRRTASASLEML